jgi:hypothetical protein
MEEHVILIAFTVEALGDREEAEAILKHALQGVRQDADDARTPRVDSWWVAEDDRHDGSDNQAAVFVPYGMTQDEARAALRTMV